jgi:hypothetical protein
VALALRYGRKPCDIRESIEFLATKVGLVLLILGVMHFGNLCLFARLRRRFAAKPPVRDGRFAAETDYAALHRAIKARPYYTR